VPDHCTAIDAVLQHGHPGETYNIGTGELITNLDVTKKILGLLGLREDMIEYVKDRPGHDRRYALDSSKIRTQLGWQPTRTFDQALTATIRWYRENEWWWKKLKNGTFRAYYRQQYGSSA
jgi:dTDP-glucose 4,6-dehydratase